MLLRVLDERPGLAAEVRGNLAATTRNSIEHTKRLGWIRLAEHMEVCEALRGILDRDYREHLRLSTYRGATGPLFGPLLQGFVRLFGPTPVSSIRVSPRAWAFVYRGVGDIVVGALEGDAITVTLRGLHPVACETDTFALGTLASLEACLDMVKYEGVAEMDSSKLDEGRVDYRVRWQQQSTRS